jgi:hypothetical protein
MEILNKTPFQAKSLLLQDADGRDQFVVAVKATFAIGANGSLTIADEQAEVQLEHEFRGEPESSSMLKESEATLSKLSTDVVVNGHVFGGPGIRQLDAGIRVGNLKNVCRVFGERHWIKRTGGAYISDPAPFEEVALSYENAFGGADTSHEDPALHAMEPRNPVGCGLSAKKSRLPLEELGVPSMEDPAQLLKSLGDKPAPVGFGFMSPLWQPRQSLAGTYDQKWQDERMPHLPEDFDHRFYNSANPKLISDNHFQGGEIIQLVNIGKTRKLRFELPKIDFEIVNVITSTKKSLMEARLNTVLIEANESRVTLLWKATEDVYQKVHKLWRTRVVANV